MKNSIVSFTKGLIILGDEYMEEEVKIVEVKDDDPQDDNQAANRSLQPSQHDSFVRQPSNNNFVNESNREQNNNDDRVQSLIAENLENSISNSDPLPIDRMPSNTPNQAPTTSPGEQIV